MFAAFEKQKNNDVAVLSNLDVYVNVILAYSFIRYYENRICLDFIFTFFLLLQAK